MRRAEWLPRLTAYLSSIRSKPFHPVTHNCAVFTLGVIEAVRGIAPDAVLCGIGLELPQTEAGVRRLLLEQGDMRGVAERFFGCPPDAAVLNARRGDIALMDGKDGDTLGVVDNGAVVILTAKGLERHPIMRARGFWKL